MIVTAPASVILTWREQAARWRPDLRVTVDEPLRKPRQNEVLVVSQDSLPEAPRFSRKLLLEDLSDVHLIPDECHGYKGEDAKRTEKFRKLEPQCGWVWGSTGTPMLGKPEDFWGVLASLGLCHKIFPGGREEFIELCGGTPNILWIKGERVQRGWIWGEISPEIRERLKKHMLRRLRRDVNKDLPPIQRIYTKVEAPADLRPFLSKIKKKWDELDQTSSLPPFELLAEARAALAKSRIPAALEQARELTQQLGQILVFSAHVEPVLAVCKLKGAVGFTGASSLSDREKAIQKFRSGRARILAMTIEAGGLGLNLQEAAGALFVDRDYTTSMNDQAEARFYRQGQTQGVVVVYLVTDHPLDVRLQEILDEKQRLIGEVVGL